ncbi:MAG TPA: hypothetical protein VMT52_01910 [Planctomycetota bacterium]|nr:hypothetical protein [Planctomycetota bacterium]
MLRFAGKFLKLGVLVVVVLGLSVVVFGIPRIRSLISSARQAAAENIDSLIPNEVKLRNDMEKLREEYPRRIAELKAMIDELARQIAATERDRRLCREVLAICEEDLGQLKPKLELLSSEPASRGTTVEFRGVSFSYLDAMGRSRKIIDIKEMYDARLEAGTGSLEVIQSEHERLKAELIELQKEYDQFIAEYRTLERDIEILRHTEKLIEIAKRRERIDRIDPSGWARSLDELKRALRKHKTEQDERLRSYRIGNAVEEYETRARIKEL